jgi:hypothetical protein
MSTDVERRLAEVLQRRADDAMDGTDTQEQLRRFLSRQDAEPPRPRRTTAMIGAALAAAAVAAAVFWGADLTDDRSEPAPVQEPGGQAVRVADEFVAALDAGDAERMRALMKPGETPWVGWRVDLRVYDALSFEHLLDPCQKVRQLRTGTEVACTYALHALHSAELGRGPFDRNIVTMVVKSGRVVMASNTTDYDNNGQSEHFDAVADWIRVHHPGDAPLLIDGNPWAMTDSKERKRWLRLWERYGQEYVDAQSQGAD